MSFQGSGWRAWEPEQKKSIVPAVRLQERVAEKNRRWWENAGDTVHQGNETHFCFRAINSSINILTNPIKGLATLCILASSLPSPDSNHFSAYIKLSNKKVLLVTLLTYCTFQGCPATVMFSTAISPVNYSVSFSSPSLVFAYPMQGHSWS